MKIQIRRGVFETNSSSVHALSISKSKSKFSKIKDSITKITFGPKQKYCWDADSAQDKINQIFKIIKNMKTQIRRSIFETNSSSTHSITMVSGSEYDKWKNGELLYDKDTETLVTKEEIEKIKENDKKIYESNGWPFDESEYDYNSEDSNIRFLTYNKFFDLSYIHHETFTDNYKTKNGEEVVAFGFFGYEL